MRMRFHAAIGRALCVLVGTLAPTMLFLSGVAAQTEGETPDESRSTAFQAVEGAVKEDIAGGPLLLATYAVIWIVLFLYVLRLVGLQKRTQAELEGLRAALGSDPSDK